MAHPKFHSSQVFLKALLGTLEFRKIGDFILRKDSGTSGIRIYTKKTLEMQEKTEKKLNNLIDKEYKKREWEKTRILQSKALSKLQPNPISEDELKLIE